LKSLFDQTKKIYSQKDPILSADELNINEPAHRSIIRVTNLATFVSSVFGGGEIPFWALNNHFIDTFTPDDIPMSKEAGDLFLSLKTQMFLSAVAQDDTERPKEEFLEDFFPTDLGDWLEERHPEVPLSEDEEAFLEEAKTRREYLNSEAEREESFRKFDHNFL
jgi:hypothetical protein